MLNEEMELEVTEGEEEGEEEADPVTVTGGDEVGITVAEAEEEGVAITEGEGEGDVLSVAEGDVLSMAEGDVLSVAEGEGDPVAVAVDAGPRAQQRVTLVEKVLPSINWHP